MLVNIIKIIHLIIVLLIISSVFIDNLFLKKYVLIFLIYLLFQYLTGYERCGITELEYLVMNEKYKEGFMYRIINPLIKVPEHYFNKWLFVFHILYIIILFQQIYNPIYFNVISCM
jgi:hypothetical protein